MTEETPYFRTALTKITVPEDLLGPANIDLTTSTITVRRRFAVWLEDAFEVERPTDEELAEYDGDLDAWALANIDDLYAKANDPNNVGVRMMWEDQHKADLDFPESEVTVDKDDNG